MPRERLRVAAGVGVTVDTLDRMQALVEAGADAIVIDTAHGHSKYVIEKLIQAKAAFPNVDIVVGNVATGAAAKMLVDNGADAIKVGIGPGSICTTRGCRCRRSASWAPSMMCSVRQKVLAFHWLLTACATRDIVKAFGSRWQLRDDRFFCCWYRGESGETIISTDVNLRATAVWVRLRLWEQKNGSKDRYFQSDKGWRSWFRKESLAVYLTKELCRRWFISSLAVCVRYGILWCQYNWHVA